MKLTYDFKEFFQRVKTISDYYRLWDMGFRTQSIAGMFFPTDVPELLAFCEEDPRYHLTSALPGGIIVNRYDTRGGCHKLAEGDNDPDYTLNSIYALQMVLPMFLHKK